MTDEEIEARTNEWARRAAGNYDESKIALNVAAFVLARTVVVGGDARATAIAKFDRLVANHEERLVAARRRGSH